MHSRRKTNVFLEFIDSVKHGNIQKIELYFKHGYLNKPYRLPINGRHNVLQAVHVAAYFGQVRSMEWLMQHGGNISCQNNKGMRPINFAIMNGCTNAIGLKSQNLRHRNYRHERNRKLLYRAASYGHMAAMEWLISHGENVDCTDKMKRTPIFLAAQLGKIKAMECLINHGADINHKDKWNETVVHRAAIGGKTDALKWLINKNVDINGTNDRLYQPIHNAALEGHLNAVTLLLDHGADPWCKDNLGRMPIDIAALEGREKVVEYLKRRYPDMKTNVSDFQIAAASGNIGQMQSLVDCGNSVDEEDEIGWRPIHRAARRDQLKAVQWLVEHGADIEAEVSTKKRPFYIAAFRDRKSIVKYLLTEVGCVLDGKDKNGRTALDRAKEKDYKIIVDTIKCEEDSRKKDEFQIFHFSTFSAIFRKYKIYDLQNAVEKIKTEISCINRPIVVCHLADRFRRLPPILRAFRIVGKWLQYPEYLVEDLQQSEADFLSRISKLRDWDVRVTADTSTLEIHLEIDRQTDPTKWSRYATVSMNLLNEQSHSVTGTVHMLVMDNMKGADIKEAFINFQRFNYCSKLFATFDGHVNDSHDGIHWLRRWMVTQKKMITFYRSNREKLSNISPIIESNIGKDVKISVVHGAAKNVQFIPVPPDLQWTIEFASNLLFQEHILIRCITDDDLIWSMPRTDLINAGDIKNRLLPNALDENCRGRLLLLGSKGELPDETEMDNIDSVIHYAVILPKQKVEKIENIRRGSYGLVVKCKMQNDEKIYAMKKMDIFENEKEETIRYTINEVMVAARVGSHPNIIKYRLFFEYDLAFCIIMDCMKESLYDHIRNNYPLGETIIISFAKQILEGIKHLHDQKVIHRDIKCKNVLLDDNGCIKLCDFGICKCQTEDTDRVAMEGGNTQIGTHRYMAPELLGPVITSCRKYGQKVDIWAYGTMMVEMITGKELYPGIPDAGVGYQVAKYKMIEYKYPAMYSGDLKEFVDMCLIGDHHGRPSCAELLQNVIFHGFSLNGQNIR